MTGLASDGEQVLVSSNAPVRFRLWTRAGPPEESACYRRLDGPAPRRFDLTEIATYTSSGSDQFEVTSGGLVMHARFALGC